MSAVSAPLAVRAAQSCNTDTTAASSAEPTLLATSRDAGKVDPDFGVRLAQLWPSALQAPSIASPAKAVAVAQKQGRFSLTTVDAKGDASQEKHAQSIGYSTADGHFAAGVQRVQSTAGKADDISQSVSVAYDDCSHVRMSGGVATDRGTQVADPADALFSYYNFTWYGAKSRLDARWNSAGDDYHPTDGPDAMPGTQGYSLDGRRAFGAVALDGTIDRYRDTAGQPAQADQQLKLSVGVVQNLNLSLTSGSRYTGAGGSGLVADNRNGVSVDFAPSSGISANAAYKAGAFEQGFINQSDLRTSIPLDAQNAIALAQSRTAYHSASLADSTQLASSARFVRRFKDGGSVALGYRFVTGAPPGLLQVDGSTTASLTFSLDRRLPFAMLHVTYSDPNTLFPSPNFAVKLSPGG